MERDINETNGAVQRVSSGAHKTIDKVSGALRPGVDHLAENAHHAVDRVADVTAKLQEKLVVGSGQLKQAQARFSDERRVQIRESPLASVGVAFGAGLVLGLLLRSR